MAELTFKQVRFDDLPMHASCWVENDHGDLQRYHKTTMLMTRSIDVVLSRGIRYDDPWIRPPEYVYVKEVQHG